MAKNNQLAQLQAQNAQLQAQLTALQTAQAAQHAKQSAAAKRAWGTIRANILAQAIANGQALPMPATTGKKAKG